MQTFRTRALALLALLALGAIGFATVVVQADVARLTRLSGAIVDGVVEAERTTLDADDGSIWTSYDVRVSETIAGEERKSVTVDVPGGQVGALSQEVSGATRLVKGERAVLFLTLEEGRWLVLGAAQGCFRVTNDAASGARIAQNDVAGLALVSETGDQVDAQALRFPLADLRAKIAATLAEQAEEQRLRREAEERRLAELRASAERHAELMRGKPGGGE